MASSDRDSPVRRAWSALQRIVGRPTLSGSAPRHGAQSPATAEAPASATLPVFAPPGHYYSPVPSAADVDSVAAREGKAGPPEGIDLREPAQLALLEELARFYPAMPFAPAPVPGLRYRFDNESYSYADGIFLYSMLRHVRPRRLIEVGSGFTSALVLDTNERFLDNRLECTFIEPHPELLLSLLSEDDRRRARLIAAPLQEVDVALFESLEAGDILFVDSTHVAKANSDVNRLFFEILPRLAPGTLVHLHDVFPSFEYPLDWLRQGRAWNESLHSRAGRTHECRDRRAAARGIARDRTSAVINDSSCLTLRDGLRWVAAT